MAVKVSVPNKNYNEVFMGVEFKDGEAVVPTVADAQEFARFGYEIEEMEQPKPVKKAPAKKAPKKVEG
jgi:hypothetical protein